MSVQVNKKSSPFFDLPERPPEGTSLTVELGLVESCCARDRLVFGVLYPGVAAGIGLEATPPPPTTLGTRERDDVEEELEPEEGGLVGDSNTPRGAPLFGGGGGGLGIGSNLICEKYERQ